MPKCNSAANARSIYATSRRFATAMRTRLVSPRSEILAVFFSVAIFAQCFAVANVKSEGSKLGPRFDVVGVQSASFSTDNTPVVISGKNIFAPLRYVAGKPGSLPVERVPILPRWRVWTDHVFEFASHRTVLGSFVTFVKWKLAIWTEFENWFSSVRPTLRAAKLRVCGTVLMRPVRFAADGANKGNTPLSGINGLVFDCWHENIMASGGVNCNIFPAYCDVIVKRWENLTGQKATLEREAAAEPTTKKRKKK